MGFVKFGSFGIQVFHKQTRLALWALLHYCVPIYLQFLSLFTSTGVSKHEIRNKRVYEHCILRLNATLDWLIFNDRANLTKYPFFYFVRL